MTDPLLSVRDLQKHYPLRRGLLNRKVGAVKAVDGISFDIHPGETLGLVGESGCGKSTAASSILRLEEPTGGEVLFNGGDRGTTDRRPDGTHPNDVTAFDKAELKRFRRDAQMIFQDPSSSFNPRTKIGSSIAELLLVHGMDDRAQRRAIVEDLLERVNLSATDYDRYPHEFSGGQKQRIALARALVLNPDLIVADEPVSALDVSVQAEVLSLIDELQDEFELSLLFISHDMAIIREICDRVAVMYLGEIVEMGETETVFSDPQHPYTEALLSAIPTADPRDRREEIELPGTVPSPANPPSGCRFHTRCHRVVQPDDLDIEQGVFRALLTFRDRIAGDEVDVPKIRTSVRAEQGSAPDEAVRAEIRAEFDLPEDVAHPEARAALSDALDALVAGDDEAAAEVLGETFHTPCERTKPDFTDHGAGHESACIRHREEVAGMGAIGDDD